MSKGCMNLNLKSKSKLCVWFFSIWGAFSVLSFLPLHLGDPSLEFIFVSTVLWVLLRCSSVLHFILLSLLSPSCRSVCLSPFFLSALLPLPHVSLFTNARRRLIRLYSVARLRDICRIEGDSFVALKAKVTIIILNLL